MSPQSPVDLVRELMRMLEGTSIVELEVERGDVTVSIHREMRVASVHLTGPASETAQSTGSANGHEEDGTVVTAGYVGEFRWSDELPTVGDEVTTGAKLGEIEVLGIRNPVLATADGVLSAILVDNEAPVEYGQPLAVISPSSSGGGVQVQSG